MPDLFDTINTPTDNSKLTVSNLNMPSVMPAIPPEVIPSTNTTNASIITGKPAQGVVSSTGTFLENMAQSQAFHKNDVANQQAIAGQAKTQQDIIDATNNQTNTLKSAVLADQITLTKNGESVTVPKGEEQSWIDNGYQQTGGGTSSAGDPNLDNIQNQINNANATTQQGWDSFQKTVNGPVPLTQAQQMQLDSIAAEFNQLKIAQAEANKNFESGTEIMGIVSGRQRYAPEIQAGNFKRAVDQGISKIAAIDSQMASTLSSMTTAFEEKNYTRLRQNWQDFSDFQKQKTDALQKIKDDLVAAKKDIQAQKDAQDKAIYERITKPIEDIALSASKGGASPEVLAAINNAKSVNDALIAAGDTLKTPLSGIVGEYQFYVQDAKAAGQKPVDFNTYQTIDANRKAVIAKAGATTVLNSAGESVAIGTTGNPGVDTSLKGYATATVGQTGLTQASIDQAALSYALTGQMPSIGLGSTGQAGERRNAIMNRAAELDAGGNIQAHKAEIKALSESLDTQTAYAKQVERSMAAAHEGMQQVIDKFKEKGINTSSVTLINIIKNKAKYQLNPEDIAAFQAGLIEVSNEYQQVFSRGGQVSDKVRAQADKIANGDISLTALQSVGDELFAQAGIVKSNANTEVSRIQEQINHIIDTGAKATTSETIINQNKDNPLNISGGSMGSNNDLGL